MSDRPQIVLTMIVRNEEHVIDRCLASVLPHVDAVVVVDTGSTDGTKEAIREAAEGEGIVHYICSRTWVDFAINRNQVLDVASEMCGSDAYALMIDADEELHVPDDWAWPALTAPGYSLEHRSDHDHYQLVNLVRLDGSYRYAYPVHEVAVGPRPEPLVGPWITGHFDSARNQDAAKYYRDALVLSEYLEQHRDDPRALFYLGQSYRNARMWTQARDTYLRRVLVGGGFHEEAYISMLSVARISEQLGDTREIVLGRYLQAWSVRPTRHEAPLELARLFASVKLWAQALFWARTAAELRESSDRDALFVERSHWLARELASRCCEALGDLREATRYAGEALETAPPVEQEAVERRWRDLRYRLAQEQSRAERDVAQ